MNVEGSQLTAPGSGGHIGTLQRAWRLAFAAMQTYNGAMGDPTTYVGPRAKSLPAVVTANSIALLGPIEKHAALHLRFMGIGAAATFNAKIWAVNELHGLVATDRNGPCESIADLIADLTLTTGTTAVDKTNSRIMANLLGASTGLWVPAGSVTTNGDYSYNDSIVKWGDGANGAGIVSIDGGGAHGYIIQLELGTATGMNALWRIS
jgi:hypothetical protein